MLGVIDPATELLAQLRPALASQIGAAADAVPDHVLLKMALNASRRQRREQWMRHLPFGSVDWPAAYHEYYERYAQGRRVRLSAHAILIDALVHRVITLAFARYHASRAVHPSITPHVVFRTQENNPACAARSGLHWPIERRAEAWKMLVDCQRPDCACWVDETNDKGIEQIQRLGITLRPSGGN